MKSNKHNVAEKENDLNFVPLNIQEPFKFNSTTLSPIIKFDDNTISANSKDIFIGFPPLLNTADKAINAGSQPTAMPLMPYPISTPILESTNITPKNINVSTNSDTLDYPSGVDSSDLYSYNKPRINSNYLDTIINPIDILRTFDLQDDIIDDNLRGGYTAEDIDNIFKSIESNNIAIIGTLKTYKIPYPIAKLLVKKIIKLTLDYNNGRC